jgi:dihydroorotate dehydrogenase (fumarate)
MRDLSVDYLGLRLAHPIVVGASPIADRIDAVLRYEDAGACAIVMRSIFEEQLELEQLAAHRHLDAHEDAEASSIAPDTDAFALGLDAYLEQLARIRARTRLVVIGSLNGATPGGWTDYARRIEAAGAHALELNLYTVPADPARAGHELEAAQLATVRAVAGAVAIPVAVKLSPFYSSLPHFVRALEGAGARGAVLFNRFYQADIDPVALETVRTLHLSTPDELLLRLRWLAIVSPQTTLALAASGGVHDAGGAVRALMAGARAVQCVSALLEHGPPRLRAIIDGLAQFLDEHDYPSIDPMIGSMSHARCPDPGAYERADYIQLLRSWHGPAPGGARIR